jgi:hypothetical protein
MQGHDEEASREPPPGLLLRREGQEHGWEGQYEPYTHQDKRERPRYPPADLLYRKPHPTFSDALALVRRDLWAYATFRESPADTDTVKVSRGFVEHLTETLCYAA